ncbi:hypothetical protein HYH03_006315 [Edaphochlamys debaryana]|uniref:Survival protein SurE-like phosphatase/nucleotidase domain-containing protein n=1 Tax=Edaphochlamys debaryana TaxID=47281 RepID=A0A836C0G4_9CHLO|nr:hypothetical protein HYH03_006315 [Edaphochlamys debaryana]|eukprot:KAG2495715.1 hypothetical protein HYH03_006315 [Edaphochlamys debaryana]
MLIRRGITSHGNRAWEASRKQLFPVTRSLSSAVRVKSSGATPVIVLCNDDGVESKATQLLAGRLREETGYRVVLLAPDRNKSAASMGLTLRTDMELRARPDLGPDTYSLSGTPTDCMMVSLDATKGLLRALGAHPVLALSGPNYGPNMGTDVLLSGTVGAARTAGLYGVPAIASSSTSLDKASALENAVDATMAMVRLALGKLNGAPARNWPRDHVNLVGPGRRHVGSSCSYEALPDAWILDTEQVLVDAFADGDVFLNLNVPQAWGQAGSRGRIQTTGLGLMFYRDSYVVKVPGKAPMAAQRQPTLVAAALAAAGRATASAAGSIGAGAISGATIDLMALAAAQAAEAQTAPPAYGGNNGNGVGTGDAISLEPHHDVIEDISKALSLGQTVSYNNAYDTRRTVTVEHSDVMALQQGDMSISTLQTWPEGHTLCLSDRVMARALLSGHDGRPAWLLSQPSTRAA